MKLIATTKLSRAQNNVKKAQNYYKYLSQITRLVEKIDSFKEHFLIQEKNKVKKIKIMIFTSDKGLCGAFNNNTLKLANHFINTKKNDQSHSVEIRTEHFGKKGNEFFKKKNIVDQWYEKVFKEDFQFSNAIEFVEEKISNFKKNQLDEFYIIYSRFDSILKQTPIIKRLIPLVAEPINFSYSNSRKDTKTQPNEKNKVNSNPQSTLADFIFEPNQKEVINQVIKKIINFEFYYGYLNTIAGENSARMTAMDSATNNCNDMIDRFTLERNQLRQANITKELIEIISGAESV